MQPTTIKKSLLSLTPMEENSTSDPPLFSCFITLSTLFLIYDSLRLLLSPVLLISLSLLFSLLLLGPDPEPDTRPGKSKEGQVKTEDEETEQSDHVHSLSEAKARQDSDTRHDFVEWDLRAPLEVIHESAYEEEDDPSGSGEKDPTRVREIERHPSLSLCYPETDSGSDSDSSSEFTFPEMSSWMSPEKMGYRWEEDEEDRGGGLIEIKLEDDEYNKKEKKRSQTVMDFHAEEEGLIEIDLFH